MRAEPQSDSISAFPTSGNESKLDIVLVGGGGSTGNKMVLEGPSKEVILQPRPERWAGAAKGGAGRMFQAEGTWSVNRMSQWVDVHVNKEEGVFCVCGTLGLAPFYPTHVPPGGTGPPPT